MKFKKIISLFTAIMLVVGSLTAVSAAAFPDMEERHAWAEEAVDSMVNRGILKGYTDGTFKPDRAVTHMETLIIAARIMGVDGDENSEYKDAAVKQYSSALSSYDIPYINEVSYLLYCGILSIDELPNYISESKKDEPLKRYEAAVLLTKLIGGEEAALAEEEVVLDFEDEALIPSNAKAYVKYVSEVGLMKGMDESNFGPDGELTRAMIATVMYRAESYMNASVVEGMVEGKDEETITLSVKGVTETITLPENVVLKIDGKDAEIKSLLIGQYIRIHYQGEDIRYIDALTSNLYQTVAGVISAVSEAGGVKKITIKNTIGSQTYPINQDSCEFFVNNKISTYADIKKNMYATVVIRGGYINKISVETGSKKISGELKEVVINEDVVAVKVLHSDGTEADYTFNEEATITRNGTRAEIKELATGDSVTITLVQGGIESLSATSSTRSLKGTISKIVISSSPEITIKTATAENVYSITSDTKFTVDGDTKCSIYDLRLGATAEVRVDSTKLISISTQSMVVSPTLTGVITYVHPTSYVMGINVYDPATGETNVVQTVASSSVEITDTTSSKISAFKALKPGMTVVVVGTSNYGVYEVSQIIVTASVQ